MHVHESLVGTGWGSTISITGLGTCCSVFNYEMSLRPIVGVCFKPPQKPRKGRWFFLWEQSPGLGTYCFVFVCLFLTTWCHWVPLWEYASRPKKLNGKGGWFFSWEQSPGLGNCILFSFFNYVMSFRTIVGVINQHAPRPKNKTRKTWKVGDFPWEQSPNCSQ